MLEYTVIYTVKKFCQRFKCAELDTLDRTELVSGIYRRHSDLRIGQYLAGGQRSAYRVAGHLDPGCSGCAQQDRSSRTGTVFLSCFHTVGTVSRDPDGWPHAGWNYCRYRLDSIQRYAQA